MLPWRSVGIHEFEWMPTGLLCFYGGDGGGGGGGGDDGGGSGGEGDAGQSGSSSEGDAGQGGGSAGEGDAGQGGSNEGGDDGGGGSSGGGSSGGGSNEGGDDGGGGSSAGGSNAGGGSSAGSEGGDDGGSGSGGAGSGNEGGDEGGFGGGSSGNEGGGQGGGTSGNEGGNQGGGTGGTAGGTAGDTGGDKGGGQAGQTSSTEADVSGQDKAADMGMAAYGTMAGWDSTPSDIAGLAAAMGEDTGQAETDMGTAAEFGAPAAGVSAAEQAAAEASAPGFEAAPADTAPNDAFGSIAGLGPAATEAEAADRAGPSQSDINSAQSELGLAGMWGVSTDRGPDYAGPTGMASSMTPGAAASALGPAAASALGYGTFGIGPTTTTSVADIAGHLGISPAQAASTQGMQAALEAHGISNMSPAGMAGKAGSVEGMAIDKAAGHETEMDIGGPVGFVGNIKPGGDTGDLAGNFDGGFEGFEGFEGDQFAGGQFDASEGFMPDSNQQFASAGDFTPSTEFSDSDFGGQQFSSGGDSMGSDMPFGLGATEIGGDSFSPSGGSGMAGLLEGAFSGDQYASAASNVLSDGSYGLSASDRAERADPIGGPGSQLYMGATGETTQLPSDDAGKETIAKETQGSSTIDLPEVEVTPDETPNIKEDAGGDGQRDTSGGAERDTSGFDADEAQRSAPQLSVSSGDTRAADDESRAFGGLAPDDRPAATEAEAAREAQPGWMSDEPTPERMSEDEWRPGDPADSDIQGGQLPDPRSGQIFDDRNTRDQNILNPDLDIDKQLGGAENWERRAELLVDDRLKQIDAEAKEADRVPGGIPGIIDPAEAGRSKQPLNPTGTEQNPYVTTYDGRNTTREGGPLDKYDKILNTIDEFREGLVERITVASSPNNQGKTGVIEVIDKQTGERITVPFLVSDTGGRFPNSQPFNLDLAKSRTSTADYQAIPGTLKFDSQTKADQRAALVEHVGGRGSTPEPSERTVRVDTNGVTIGPAPRETQQDRPQLMSGTVVGGSRDYPFLSGNFRNESIPYGVYSLNPTGEKGPKMQAMGDKSMSINNNQPIFDAKAGRDRGGIAAHVDTGRPGTAGCIGIAPKDWPSFLADVNQIKSATGMAYAAVTPTGIQLLGATQALALQSGQQTRTAENVPLPQGRPADAPGQPAVAKEERAPSMGEPQLDLGSQITEPWNAGPQISGTPSAPLDAMDQAIRGAGQIDAGNVQDIIRDAYGTGNLYGGMDQEFNPWANSPNLFEPGSVAPQHESAQGYEFPGGGRDLSYDSITAGLPLLSGGGQGLLSGQEGVTGNPYDPGIGEAIARGGQFDAERAPQYVPGEGESLMPGQEGVTGGPQIYSEPAGPDFVPGWDPAQQTPGVSGEFPEIFPGQSLTAGQGSDLYPEPIDEEQPSAPPEPTALEDTARGGRPPDEEYRSEPFDPDTLPSGMRAEGRDKTYEIAPKVTTTQDIDKNIRTAIDRTPAEHRAKATEIYQSVTPQQRADLIAGRTTLAAIIQQNFPVQGSMIVAAMNEKVPGGIKAVQDGLLAKETRTEQLANVFRSDWPTDQYPIQDAAARGQQAPEDVTSKEDRSPPMTPTEPHPQTQNVPIGIADPGVHEIYQPPGALTPPPSGSISPPNVDNIPPQVQQDVQQIQQQYGVNWSTALAIYISMLSEPSYFGHDPYDPRRPGG